MKRKGIILAGGFGTRLRPITNVTSKHLLPIFDKPMIYYPLTSLMLAGVSEIIIIVKPSDKILYQALLSDGSDWGLNISYAEQPEPNGIPQALTIAEDFLADGPCVLILGDNIFHGDNIKEYFQKAQENPYGASILTFPVKTPESYGVAEIDSKGDVISIEEKPKKAKSSIAITGMYFLDKSAPKMAKSLKQSNRGELEITDLLNLYIKEEKLKNVVLGSDVAWFDAGTFESLITCGKFVQTIQKSKKLKIGCPEEVAFRMNFIKKSQLINLIKQHKDNDYSQYLNRLLKSDNLS